MIPSSSELHYFLEVSSTLNVSRAAERLGITQPTLSLAIQRLEHGFGVPLLIRSKSGVKLTPTGKKLAGEAKNLIEAWEKLKNEALKDELEIRGQYVLGCHPSVALYSLPFFVTELLVDHPGLELKIVHDLSRRITEEVISFKVDFGIVVNPVPHPDLVIRPLCEDRVCLWTRANPTPLQTAGQPNSVLIYDPDLRQSQSILTQLEKAGYQFARSVLSSNLEVVFSLVAAGSGVGILPTRVATRLPSVPLELLCPDAPAFSDRICLVYRADRQRSPSSKKFLRYITSYFAGSEGSLDA